MSGRKDLTRWNRAGLTRFRYVDGNAVEYLETLRQQLVKQFKNPKTGLCEWLNPAEEEPANEKEVDNETLIQRQERLGRRRERILDTYRQDRRDWAWEITRTFARACHILTEHANAYANEGYLGTATQWDNVRRLVEMLDYLPAPPASASTKLALEAKESKSGMVKKGWQVKYKPPEGDKAVFETLDDIQVHHELNGIRLEGYDKSQKKLTDDAGVVNGTATWRWGTEKNGGIEDLELSAGNVALLLNTDIGQAISVSVEEILNETNEIRLSGISGEEEDWIEGTLPNGTKPWTKGATQLRLSPKDILTPRLSGDNVVLLDRSHPLKAGDVIAWEDVSNSVWVAARIANGDGQAIELFGTEVPSQGSAIYQLLKAYPQSEDPESGNIVLPLALGANETVWKYDLTGTFLFGTLVDNIQTKIVYSAIYYYIESDGFDNFCYYLPDNSPVVGSVTEDSDVVTSDGNIHLFDGSPGDLVSGQWVVAENEDSVYLALKISSITEYEDHFAIVFESSSIAAAVVAAGLVELGMLKRCYGPFEHTLYPEGHDRNETEITNADEFLALPGDISDEALALLKPGRPLVLEHEDGSGEPVSIEVSKMKDNDLYLSRKLEQDEDFTVGNFIIRGNVVLAGHGEAKPEKILGSGNAMLSNQSFILEVEGVAFPADATKSSGVAAAMDVSVNGQIWKQVYTLKDSVPGDNHYAIRMTEEGYVKIIFGDGEYGRRLPSGSNNVRVRYRVGSGLDGNVPKGGLEKPVNPHPLIEAVRQPLQAAGGSDMEDVASLRENAPPTLLALERAVSLSDFSHLAASQSSVWQAKAYSEILHGGRTESVRVVIVPAGGVTSEGIEGDMENFLQKHALPGVQVAVDPFEDVRFDLEVVVRVKFDEFMLDEVKKAVESALADHFTLKNRKLGEHLYLSEVYKVVEGIQGVDNSICVLNDDKAKQVIEAGDESTVVYLDTDADKSPSMLTVIAEEYLP